MLALYSSLQYEHKRNSSAHHSKSILCFDISYYVGVLSQRWPMKVVLTCRLHVWLLGRLETLSGSCREQLVHYVEWAKDKCSCQTFGLWHSSVILEWGLPARIVAFISISFDALTRFFFNDFRSKEKAAVLIPSFCTVFHDRDSKVGTHTPHCFRSLQQVTVWLQSGHLFIRMRDPLSHSWIVPQWRSFKAVSVARIEMCRECLLNFAQALRNCFTNIGIWVLFFFFFLGTIGS